MTVGVVIGVRGPAPYLDAALAGLAAQTVAVDRVVVVDDASPQPIPGALRLDAPVGPGGARNAGVAALDTDWVGFCDADDVWAADQLERQLAVAARADVIVGSARVIGPDGEPTGERWPPFDPDRLYAENGVVTSSVLVRAEVLQPFDSGLAIAEDWDLWLRLAAAGARFVSVPEAVVSYRRHAGSVTADLAALARAGLEVQRRHAGLVGADVAAAAQQRSLLALQDGLIRARDWAGAAEALRSARALGPVGRRARVRGAIAAVPGVRGGLGRRDPYR